MINFVMSEPVLMVLCSLFVVSPFLLYAVWCVIAALFDLGLKIKKCGGWPTYELVKEKMIRAEAIENGWYDRWMYLDIMVSPVYLYDLAFED